jgi:hypothetical protein
MKLSELTPLDQVIEEHREDPEFRAEWDRTAFARDVANRVVQYRAEHGLSQRQLAAIVGLAGLHRGQERGQVDREISPCGFLLFLIRPTLASSTQLSSPVLRLGAASGIEGLVIVLRSVSHRSSCRKPLASVTLPGAFRWCRSAVEMSHFDRGEQAGHRHAQGRSVGALAVPDGNEVVADLHALAGRL